MCMRIVLATVFFAVLLMPVGSTAGVGSQECSPEEIFEACDINKDGKISKDEWDILDINKDQTITSDEWDKYKYQSTEQKSNPFRIKYYDVYGDGTMGREEFLKNYQRLR